MSLLPNQQAMGNTCDINTCDINTCDSVVENTCASVMDSISAKDNLKLTVLLRSACGLPETHWNRGSDRFLYVGVGEDVGGQELFKTQLKKNVVDPVWNEECHLPVGTPLVFSILQSDAKGNTEVVSYASFDLAAIGADGFNGELPLEADGMLPGGILMLKAKTEDGYPTQWNEEVVVSIDNANKKSLGLEVDSIDPEKLFVSRVKKGIIRDKYDEEHPENNIDAGCFIIGVAGADIGSGGCLGVSDCKDGSVPASASEAMLNILKQNPTQVNLVCRRAMKFRIVLTWTAEKQILGAQVPRSQLGNSLVITELEANGPLEACNTRNPEQAVEPWDRIVEVDGKAGMVADLEHFVREAQNLPRVMLTIARMAPKVVFKV